MKTLTTSTLALLASSALLLGCPSDDAESTGDDDTTTDTDPSATMTDPSVTMTDPSVTMTDPTVDTSAEGPDTTAEGPDTTATDGSSTTVDQTEFIFNDAPPERYAAVDRKGFPAVNTGLNIFGDKDAYNAATPEDDAMLMFADAAVESLRFLHWGDGTATAPPAMPGPGLNDDLADAGMDPCTAPGGAGYGECLDPSENNGGGFAIPDVVKIDVDDAAGFPNGRRLTDPVMDVILAVLMLDLDFDQSTSPIVVDGTPSILTFTALHDPDDETATFSLNPPANDVAFPDDWPYLAPPHE